MTDEQTARRALRRLARTSEESDCCDSTDRTDDGPGDSDAPTGTPTEWRWGPRSGNERADPSCLGTVPSAEEDFRAVIAAADAGVDDLEAAAAFRDRVGLEELERAVERAERTVSDCAADGRAALDAFEAVRGAAAGDHFHSGRGTSLGGDDLPASK